MTPGWSRCTAAQLYSTRDSQPTVVRVWPLLAARAWCSRLVVTSIQAVQPGLHQNREIQSFHSVTQDCPPVKAILTDFTAGATPGHKGWKWENRREFISFVPRRELCWGDNLC